MNAAAIYRHHERMVKAIDELLEAAREGRSVAYAAVIYHFLVENIDEHFSQEEEAMLHMKYPGYAAHKAAHEQFRSVELRNLGACFDQRGAGFSFVLNVDKTIRDWLSAHILGEDEQFAEWRRNTYERSRLPL